jgi:hypothetical protein
MSCHLSSLSRSSSGSAAFHGRLLCDSEEDAFARRL